MPEKERTAGDRKINQEHPTDYILEGKTITSISYNDLVKHSTAETRTSMGSSYQVYPTFLGLNQGLFTFSTRTDPGPEVKVVQLENSIWLSCSCLVSKSQLCAHQAQVLQAIMLRPELRVFFDEKLRRDKIKPVAQDYGLAQEENLDAYFELEYAQKTITIKPRIKELLPVNAETQAYLADSLLLKPQRPVSSRNAAPETTRLLVVLAEHKYYKHLYLQLFQATVNPEGKLKNPLQEILPADLIWLTHNPEEIKFYSAVAKFQHNYQTTPAESDGEALQALVKNPLQLNFYRQNLKKATGTVTAGSLVPVQVQNLPVNLELHVHLQDYFYQITGSITLEEQKLELPKLEILHEYFVAFKNKLYFIQNPDMLRVIRFFKKRNHKIIIHETKFAEFRQTVLVNLETKIRVNYSYVKPATEKQIIDYGFDETRESIIYLSDSEDFILITPVMRYGPLEIPVLSRQQIYATDARGNAFTLARDEEAENNLTAAILQQHPYFYEQLHQDCFYLHRDRFLRDGWFLDAFEAWQQAGITILGFKELKNNNLNPHKAKVNILVTSGINWFDTTIDVRFGKHQVPLKYLHKSIRNKNRFITLDDGTQGILPEEWLAKLSQYLEVGEIVGEKLRTPKVNYAGVAELYETEVLTQEVQRELARYQEQLATIEFIPETQVPPELHATLRGYQKQGLHWLNFLDQFNFGGCLADDMGLGKTIQVLAFILAQRSKVNHNTNLVVVPTSLLFNWQEEIARFAPTLQVLTSYGTNRIKTTQNLKNYEIILTSYGTLVSDIRVLKEYVFNYVILDESQNIKNPETERYRAVRLLQSRNKLVLTGTPIENNTFDIYGQLSFACPGLLGSKRYFRDHYSTPIDKFKNSQRAAELQRKVSPFILRRTKEQVAPELPDKTEMVIYCQMGLEQRRVYEAAEREIRDYISAQEEDELKKNPMHVLRGLTKLRQICNSPSLLPEGDYNVSASVKIETLLEQIESKAPYHKILVFSQFVSMLELIQKELKNRGLAFSVLTGQTKDRAGAVNKFQENEEVRVFLISLKAGGTGLNLTPADYVYLVDPWWNPAVENQAIDRTYRIGQKKNVVAVRFICPDTVEEKIRKLQEAKKELVKEVIQKDNSILKTLSKQDLLGLLGQNRI
ncbi:DEAD/DEAH box helicase [Adhaeribacter pallidiroseus]|uniref:Non-specific serine/threonine protein kinase n=1 Tax=Adhaeribacter pallidiroseus TaxID=2072847 RepID=A0A369QJQ0_9BACT|nr:DEAD/DEAH box helicase [Adhaeribacter pallidiroseus]RDC62498.1 Non-specific serine/threonine protein kinase [Adhaeribacter pallidiroseus]